MRTLEPPNRLRIGLMGMLVCAGCRRRGPKLHQCPDLDGQASYHGQFTDTGGLNNGDKVRICRHGCRQGGGARDRR